MDKREDGAEGAWEGRLCEESGRERDDVWVVQKPPSEVAATTDEECALAWAPASWAEMVEGAGNCRRTRRWEQREVFRRMG